MDRLVGAVLIVAVIGVCAVALLNSRDEHKDWQEFMAAHNCKRVADVKSSMNYGVTSSGSMAFVMESAKTGYLCDDGVTYYREE